MPSAVSPIAIPINTSRTNGLAMAWCTGDPGYSSRVANTPTESMNTPSSAPSIKYFGDSTEAGFPEVVSEIIEHQAGFRSAFGAVYPDEGIHVSTQQPAPNG